MRCKHQSTPASGPDASRHSCRAGPSQGNRKARSMLSGLMHALDKWIEAVTCAQLVAMAKRSKALEDRLRDSEAREKRTREDAQVPTACFGLGPRPHPALRASMAWLHSNAHCVIAYNLREPNKCPQACTAMRSAFVSGKFLVC